MRKELGGSLVNFFLVHIPLLLFKSEKFNLHYSISKCVRKSPPSLVLFHCYTGVDQSSEYPRGPGQSSVLKDSQSHLPHAAALATPRLQDRGRPESQVHRVSTDKTMGHHKERSFDLWFLLGFVYFPEQIRHVVWVSPSEEEEKEGKKTDWMDDGHRGK